MISAVRSVSILHNCFVDLIKESGQRVEGKWNSSFYVFQSQQPAHRNRPKPKELTWLDNGGERTEASYYVRLITQPTSTPDFISINDVIYKVVNSDERPERQYFRYLCIEQLGAHA